MPPDTPQLSRSKHARTLGKDRDLTWLPFEAAVVEPVWLPLCNDTLLFPRSSSYRYHAVHTKARRHTPGFDCSHAG